ncbi:response regulator [Puniceibacterium confluentis]|uniref:response regulator n=1 Tax=Puniceibacterium confluentis TaxID=1958944 RepID=UPI00356A4DEE
MNSPVVPLLWVRNREENAAQLWAFLTVLRFSDDTDAHEVPARVRVSQTPLCDKTATSVHFLYGCLVEMPVLRCLMVEDSETDRMMMERVLEKQPVPILLRVARTLGEARRRIGDEDSSLMFLDNTLPDGLGADFLPELSSYRRRNRLSVIIVSDWPSPFMYAKARAQDVCAIWRKQDFTPDAVSRVLREQAP